MQQQDRDEMTEIVVKAIEQVVMPHIIEIKEVIKEMRAETAERFDENSNEHAGMNQKLDATIATTDRLDERLTVVESAGRFVRTN